MDRKIDILRINFNFFFILSKALEYIFVIQWMVVFAVKQPNTKSLIFHSNLELRLQRLADKLVVKKL